MSFYERPNTSRRSRSPIDRPHSKRARSLHSESRHHHHHHHHPASPRKHHYRTRPSTVTLPLPFQASTISKHDFGEYEPMFGLYLDIQKQLAIEELPEHEVRGRWKNFVGKWNRGELAEGWYDPATLQKAQASAASQPSRMDAQTQRRGSPSYGAVAEDAASSDEDMVGPSLPDQSGRVYRDGRKSGPAIPNKQDLELQQELGQEDAFAQRQDLRHHRLHDRRQQKERLEELVPRAEAGSKDRMLEKKREKADGNRAFASAKTDGGGVEEVPESDLLGAEDAGIEGFKRQKREMERKKNDRELRREEILRARAEEREEKIREYKAKEEKTMAGLIALAKARFG